MRYRVWVCLALAGVFSTVCRPAASHTPLRFADDGTFTIVELTDLHYGENATLDAWTDTVQEKVLESESPDLVVFNGDQVTGFFWMINGQQEPGFYEQAWDQASAHVLAAGVPFAFNLGNHDHEGDLSREEILELAIATSPLSLARKGPENVTGISNYYLDVLDATGKRVAARIWILDAMDECQATASGGTWGCLGADTLAWVLDTAVALPEVPSLAFMHITLPQFLPMWNYSPTNGTKNESISCSHIETGAFKALKKAGIQAIYFGHDHVNDFEGSIDGIRLAYGRKTGYGNYPKDWRGQGARVIKLRQGESAAESETWIRLQDGSREDQAMETTDMKNSSFNQYSCDSTGMEEHFFDDYFNPYPGIKASLNQLFEILESYGETTFLFEVPTNFSDLEAHTSRVIDNLVFYVLPIRVPQVGDLALLGNTTSLGKAPVVFKADNKSAELSTWITFQDGHVHEYNVYTGVAVPSQSKQTILYFLNRRINKSIVL